MIVDQDIIQRIKVIGIFVLQFYKVLTGTLLTLFVPQACYSELTNGSEERNLQICSLMQNYENNEIYHRTTLYWNGFSFLLFVMCYMFELRREHWAIKFFDINNDIPDNALKKKIVELNTGAALYISGLAINLKEGFELARQTIASKKSKKYFENLLKNQ